MSIVTLGRPRHVPIIVVDTSNLPYVVWLEYRQSGIGGSDVAAVYGLSPFMTMKDLYWDKIGLKPAVSDERNWIEKEVGKLLEGFVAEIFEKKTGLKIHKVKKMYRHPHHEYMLADLDYVVERRDGELGVLEIKTSHPANKINWARNGIPYHVNLQGRHYMSVTDYNFCYFACLFGNNDFIIRYITRNHEFENQMIQDEGNFWYQYVAALKEPPYVENPDLVLASLGRHYGAGDKSLPIVDLSTDWACDIQRYMEYIVVLPQCEEDFIAEGDSLGHCVGNGTYYSNHVKMNTMVFFIRRATRPDRPYITLSVNMSSCTKGELYGYGDHAVTTAVKDFVNGFLKAMKQSLKIKDPPPEKKKQVVPHREDRMVHMPRAA